MLEATSSGGWKEDLCVFRRAMLEGGSGGERTKAGQGTLATYGGLAERGGGGVTTRSTPMPFGRMRAHLLPVDVRWR